MATNTGGTVGCKCANQISRSHKTNQISHIKYLLNIVTQSPSTPAATSGNNGENLCGTPTIASATSQPWSVVHRPAPAACHQVFRDVLQGLRMKSKQGAEHEGSSSLIG